MVDYIPIDDSEVQPEAPLISSLGVRWRDNPVAIAEGASGAPRIEEQALGFSPYRLLERIDVSDSVSSVVFSDMPIFQYDAFIIVAESVMVSSTTSLDLRWNTSVGGDVDSTSGNYRQITHTYSETSDSVSSTSSFSRIRLSDDVRGDSEESNSGADFYVTLSSLSGPIITRLHWTIWNEIGGGGFTYRHGAGRSTVTNSETDRVEIFADNQSITGGRFKLFAVSR